MTLEECCRLDPNHPHATNNLAYVLILLNRNKDASDICRRAYKTNALAKNYHRNWAVALMNLNQYSEAVDAIRIAIDFDKSSSSTTNQRRS